MNQQQLIFIREIARTGTIRGAAACVDRTPSALTRGLKSVENELGCVSGYLKLWSILARDKRWFLMLRGSLKACRK